MRPTNNSYTLSTIVDDQGRVWPIPAGGSEDDDGGPPATDDQPPADDAGDAEQLGDAGKRALVAEREARKQAEQERKALAAQLEELQRSQMDDHERALAEAREQAAAETAATFTGRLAQAKAESLAATRTHDPDAAVQLLGDLTSFVTEDGDVDADAMSAALDVLVESKPYLKADAAKAPVGGADQGRRPPPGPQQLSRDDLAGMSPEQIVQAKAEGRLTSLLGSS